MKNYLLTLIGLLFAIGLSAQTVKVTGTVLDEGRQPLLGVSIFVQSNRAHGTVTELNGRFTIDVAVGEKLVFSYMGFVNKTVLINKAEHDLLVIMEEDKQALDEVVVIGYGTAKKKDITGAISSVSADKLKETPAVSLNQALQGKSAGVQVQLSDNSPGGGVSVLIRGKGSINQSNDPIYVVDGIIMEGTLNNINVNDIASIDILKDASAAAIYGSRAANGVVIVTTKKGEEGKARVSFSARTSFQSPSNLPKMLTAQELAEIRIEGNVNSQMDAKFLANPQMSIEEYRSEFNALKQQYAKELPTSMFSDVERQTLLAGETYDWYDQISQTGVVQDYTVSLSGGTNKTNYYISANYYDQKGIIQGTGHRRFSFRVNLEQQIKSWLKVGVNSSYYDGATTYGGANIGNGLGANPMYPFEIDGKAPLELPYYTNPGQSNPVLSKQIDNDAKSNRFSMNAYLKIDITKDLFLKSSVSLDQVNNFSGYFAPSNIKQGQSVKGEAQIKNNRWTDVMQENSLNYSKLFQEVHRVNVMLGNTVQVNNYFGNTQYGNGFATNVMGYNNISSASEFPAGKQSSSKTRWALASFIGRLNYAYKDNYIFTFTGRYDGNSRYAEGHKWGFFPSVAGAWRISGERFMEKAHWLDDLKLRVSWGKTGNQAISNTARYSIFIADYGQDRVTSTAYDLYLQGSGNFPSGFRTSQAANNNLKWETAVQYNIGLDFACFQNSLYGSVDGYIKDVEDMLISPAYLGAMGEGGASWSNGPSLRNWGMEFALGYRNSLKCGLGYNINANLDFFRNKVTYLPSTATGSYAHTTKENLVEAGVPYGSIVGYVVDGLYQNKEEVLASGQENARVGGLKYADLDGNGVINSDDQTWIFNPVPDFSYGLNIELNYKNFDLAMFWQGVCGQDVYNNQKYQTDFWSLTDAGSNKGSRLLEAWTADNTSSTIPALTTNNTGDEGRASSYFVENGSYLKLRSLQLGYNVPTSFLSKFKMSSARFYVSGQNLLTIKSKSLTCADPENSNWAYPLATSISFGIQLGF